MADNKPWTVHEKHFNAIAQHLEKAKQNEATIQSLNGEKKDVEGAMAEKGSNQYWSLCILQQTNHPQYPSWRAGHLFKDSSIRNYVLVAWLKDVNQRLDTAQLAAAEHLRNPPQFHPDADPQA